MYNTIVFYLYFASNQTAAEKEEWWKKNQKQYSLHFAVNTGIYPNQRTTYANKKVKESYPLFS